MSAIVRAGAFSTRSRSPQQDGSLANAAPRKPRDALSMPAADYDERANLYRPRLRRATGILGWYFWQPDFWQRARIREMARNLSHEHVSILTRRPLRDVRAILDAAA
jgi:hypothetical protein